MIPQNWQSFGPAEGEDDLVVEQVEKVEQVKPKFGETIWFGSKPATAFSLNLGEDE